MTDVSSLRSPDDAVAIFDAAAEAAFNAVGRQGAVQAIAGPGRLIITGDLHDHRLNFNRILSLADLDEEPRNHLVLHEIIHGENLVNGMDLSIRMLTDVALLKLHYPERVHVLISNHELAQLNQDGISKGGISVVERFNEGVAFLFGDAADEVIQAMNRFIRSELLAIRCANGVMVAHSLPSERDLATFDLSILSRPLTDDDWAWGGPIHRMVWGRDHTFEVAEYLAEAWDVEQFIVGHQPAEMGFECPSDSILILASDHAHGMAIPMDLMRPYGQNELVDAMVPLASIIASV